MALPPEGWTQAPERAEVVDFQLPVPHISYYYDRDTPLELLFGSSSEVYGHIIGSGSFDVLLGFGPNSENGIEARLERSSVYGTVLLDAFRAVFGWLPCPPAPSTSWSDCQVPLDI